MIKFQLNFLKAGGRTVSSETHKLVNSSWTKEELPLQWKELCHFYLFIRRVIKNIIVITEAYRCYQLHTKFKKVYNILTMWYHWSYKGQ